MSTPPRSAAAAARAGRARYKARHNTAIPSALRWPFAKAASLGWAGFGPTGSRLPDQLSLWLYHGDETQLPDPKITAVEGAGNAPSYRGIAYVVIEDLDLSRFGNRIPQFSFEVMRPAQGQAAQAHQGFDQIIPGVCMIPGSGEYALATTPVHFSAGLGANT